jgi:hypothetical protein
MDDSVKRRKGDKIFTKARKAHPSIPLFDS